MASSRTEQGRRNNRRRRRRPRQRRNPRPRNGANAREKARIYDKVKAAFDPFVASVPRFSDSGGHEAPIVQYRDQAAFEITTNASGNAAVFFQLDSAYAAQYLSPTLTAGAFPLTDVGPITNCNAYAGFVTNFSAGRVVAAGIRILYGGSDTTNGGFLRVKRFTVPDFSSATAADGDNQLPTSPTQATIDSRTFRVDDTITVLPMPIDNTANEFKPLTSSHNSREVIGLFWSGCAASTLIAQVTTVQHWELLPEVGSIMSETSVSPNVEDDSLVASISSDVWGYMAEKGETIVSESRQMLSDVVRDGFEASWTHAASAITALAGTYVANAYQLGNRRTPARLPY